MLGSLRFRLPALFLAGIVVSGVIAAAIALALFQNYAHKQLLAKLRREANGLTQLYQRQAIAANNTGARPLRFAPAQLERATGDKIFYVGADVFPRSGPTGLGQLPQDAVAWRQGKTRTFEFRPPGFQRTYLAVLQPMRLAPKSSPFGALIVATPKTEIASGLRRLLERLGLALIGGIVAAGLPRRVPARRARPPGGALPAGARAADGRGRDPARSLRRGRARRARRRRDRRPGAELPRDGGAAQRGRAAGTQLPHECLARAAHAADGDPRPRRGAARGRRRRSRT